MNTESNTPKKYIRTLAGDIGILKSGGIPDLVPLSESGVSQTPSERLIAASPVVPPVIPVSNTKLEPPAEQLVQPPKPTIPTPIKTYESDFSDRMEEVHASTATVLAAEQDAGPKIYQSASNSSKKSSPYYIYTGITLIVLSIFGVYFTYTRYSASLATIVLSPTVSAPIFVDERKQISGTGVDLLLEIEQSAVQSLASGAVRLLYSTNATTTEDNNIFTTAFKSSAPDILLRNVNADGSMAGIVNIDGNQSPFFILSVTSYRDTFSGMLSWESLIPRDLGALFPAYPILSTSSTTATTTVTTTKTISSSAKPSFHDDVVNNHDVRIDTDAEGRSILLYGYWNQTTLVIARNPLAFAEILRRLATSRAQ